jgi:hypothetical protein
MTTETRGHRYEAYFYACDSHSLGLSVRRLAAPEEEALRVLSRRVPHATNCWIKGCQAVATQVRLAEVVV